MLSLICHVISIQSNFAFFGAFWNPLLAHIQSFALSVSYSHFFKYLLWSQRSRTSGVTWAFTCDIPSQIFRRLCHWYIEGEARGICVHVIILQTEVSKFPTYCCLKCVCHILVFKPKVIPQPWLGWLFGLYWMNSEGGHHRSSILRVSAPRKLLVLWMLTPG